MEKLSFIDFLKKYEVPDYFIQSICYFGGEHKEATSYEWEHEIENSIKYQKALDAYGKYLDELENQPTE